jgi:TolC family type I secretion outer membrane protein
MVLGTLLASPALAENPPVSLTLQEAIAAAVANNPEMTAAEFRLEAAQSRVRQAKSGYFPQLTFSETFNRTNNPVGAFGTKLNQAVITQQDFAPEALNDPDAINNFVTAFNLEWSLYNGGQTMIGTEQAEQDMAGSNFYLQRTRQQVIARTARAYVGLLLAEKSVVVIQEALASGRANLSMVESRFRSGFVVKSDLLRARVRIAELEQELLTAQSGVDIAQAQLAGAMGAEGDRRYQPVNALENCRAIENDRRFWIEQATGGRPDLQQIRIQETIAEKEIDKTRAAHMPDVNLFGTYEINSEDFSETADNYTVGAMFRLNLYSGHRISAQTAEARAVRRQVQAMRRAMELGVRVETEQAYLEARSAWQRIAVAEKAVEQAEEGLRIVKNRYNNGLLTIVDLLDAEVTLQRARTRLFQSLHDHKVARIRLTLAAGVLDEDFR